MVSKAIGERPVVSADVGRKHPMRVERYMFQARQQRLPALECAVLVVHLGGARVSGGKLHGRPSSFIAERRALPHARLSFGVVP